VSVLVTFVMDSRVLHVSHVEHVFATVSGHRPDGLPKYPLIVVRRGDSVQLLVEMLCLIYPFFLVVCEAEAPLPAFRSSVRVYFRPYVAHSSREYPGPHLAEPLR
jgi:hypothetical protein